MLKKEVDALQVAIMEQRKPWYKNISTLISIMALIFSFGTTFVSYLRTQSQDIQNTRVELRGLLQRLAYLPRDNFELTKKYADDPAAIALLSGFVNQENALLARQAAEITRRLPGAYVSATEYYAVALALQGAYNNDGAKEFFTKAIGASKDLNDRVSALRMHAHLLFITGQPEAGRIDYQKALGVFSEFSGYNDFTKKSTHIWTELAWAYSEASIGFRDIAIQHIANAESNLSGLIPSPAVDQLKSQINQARTMWSTAPPPSLPIPSSGPPVSVPSQQTGVR